MTSLFDLSHIVKAHPDRIRYWRSKGLIPKGTQVHKYAPIIFSEAEVQEIKKFFKDKNDWRRTTRRTRQHSEHADGSLGESRHFGKEDKRWHGNEGNPGRASGRDCEITEDSFEGN
jgi:hypothetical protein